MDSTCSTPENYTHHNGPFLGPGQQYIHLPLSCRLCDLLPHRVSTYSHILNAHPPNLTPTDTHNPLAFMPPHLYNPHR